MLALGSIGLGQPRFELCKIHSDKNAPHAGELRNPGSIRIGAWAPMRLGGSHLPQSCDRESLHTMAHEAVLLDDMRLQAVAAAWAIDAPADALACEGWRVLVGYDGE